MPQYLYSHSIGENMRFHGQNEDETEDEFFGEDADEGMEEMFYEDNSQIFNELIEE